MKVVLKDTIITRRKPIMLGVRNYARDYYCAEIIRAQNRMVPGSLANSRESLLSDCRSFMHSNECSSLSLWRLFLRETGLTEKAAEGFGYTFQRLTHYIYLFIKTEFEWTVNSPCDDASWIITMQTPSCRSRVIISANVSYKENTS